MMRPSGAAATQHTARVPGGVTTSLETAAP